MDYENLYIISSVHVPSLTKHNLFEMGFLYGPGKYKTYIRSFGISLASYNIGDELGSPFLSTKKNK